MFRITLIFLACLLSTYAFAQKGEANNSVPQKSYPLTPLMQGFKVDTAQILAQRAIRGSNIPVTDKELTLTITVVSSDKPFHVATLRYYDVDGNPILNTLEEFKINVSSAKRFASGSILKTVPIYTNTASIKVEVAGCVNMHENEFLIEEAEVANYEVALLFRAEVENMIAVKFEGILEEKPGTFKIQGFNTSIIYYADYNGATKYLPDEANVDDVTIELSETSLHNYEIGSLEVNKNLHLIQAIVTHLEEPVEKSNSPRIEEDIQKEPSNINNRKKRHRGKKF